MRISKQKENFFEPLTRLENRPANANFEKILYTFTESDVESLSREFVFLNRGRYIFHKHLSEFLKTKNICRSEYSPIEDRLVERICELRAPEE
jgi:hypothetical protein